MESDTLLSLKIVLCNKTFFSMVILNVTHEMNMMRSGKSYVSEFLEVLKSQRLEGAGTSVEYILRCTHEKMYIVVKRTYPNAELNFQAQISPCSHT